MLSATQAIGSTPGELEPDRATLDRFGALFCHADPNSYIAARAFSDSRQGSRPILLEWIRVDDPQRNQRLFDCAQRAARHNVPANFCPPIATFLGAGKADEASICNGLVLTVECDHAPAYCRGELTAILGEPTMVVASGGQWTDPQSERVEERLHLHWRLAKPTRDRKGHDQLKEARRLACALVKADASAVPISHPLRWAGSVHRKGTPKLARIVDQTDNELNLDEALRALRAACPVPPPSAGGESATGPQHNGDGDRDRELTASDADIAAALAEIRNDNLAWDEWSRIGLAIWGATDGAGFSMFDSWSRKSDKFDATDTAERWKDYGRSPPNNIGAGTLFYLANQAAPGWRGAARQAGGEGHQGKDPKAKHSRAAKTPRRREGDVRPDICLAADNIAETVDQAEQAMIAGGAPVYQRGGLIVGVGAIPMLTAHGKVVEQTSIFELGEHRLLELIMCAAAFERWDARAGGFVPCAAPMTIAKTLRERRGNLRLRPLSGLINAPTMRLDGTLIEAPGYDVTTGLLFDPAGVEFQPVPDRPTQKDAEVALGAIIRLIKGFPFVGVADLAVALAAILTAVIRKSLPAAPAFAFTAPVAGSGKSTLVDITSLIATGRQAGVIAIGSTGEEAEKRVGSLLLGGSDIAIDNVEGSFGNELLCQLLTQASVRIRVLGRSETPELPTNVMVTVTGNNLTIEGDVTRRTLLCQLDPKAERPELREFEFDPVTQAKKDRGALVVAALTVLRAFHVAGRPYQVQPLGSFGDWSDLVRSALMWLGCADPVETIEHSRAYDPQIERLRAVMLQWAQTIGSESISAHEVAQRASEKSEPSPDGRTSFVYSELRAALLAVAGANGFIEPGKLGSWLGKVKARIIDGMSFEPAGTVAGIKKWRLTLPVGHASPQPQHVRPAAGAYWELPI